MKNPYNPVAVMLCTVVLACPLGAQGPAQSVGLAVHSDISPPAAFVGAISGTVTDKNTGQPLSSVQISVVGTTLGSVTDNAGKYRISGVTAGAVTLHVRFIGYAQIDRTVTVTDGGTATANFVMETQTISLDALVITGTAGGTKAREVGNAIGILNPSTVADAPAVNVQQLLGQRLSSVVVLPVAGNIGSGSAITIRGAASLSLQTQPIIYVDGVRVDNSVAEGPSIRQGRSASRLNDFNPEDIESIQVIKGPAAATLYGTEASNGVIQIITKRGRSGASRLDVTLREGRNYMANARDKMGMVYGRDPNTAQVDSFSVFDLYKEQNNGADLFTMGRVSSVNASLSGGTDAARYYASVEHSGDNGIVPYNWQNMTSGRVNLGLLPSKTWKFDASLAYNQSETRFAQAADQFGIWEMMIWASPSLLNADTKGWRYATPAVAASIDSRSKVGRFTGSADITNTPFEWFTQQLKVGLDASSVSNQILFPKVPAGQINLQGARAGGQKTIEAVTTPYQTLDYSATAKADFFGTTTATSVGAQYYRRQTTTQSAVGSNFPTPDISTISGAASSTGGETFVENKTLGFYVQEALGWKDRRFVTVALRGDANSAFGSDYAAAYYPKLSGAWVLSEEPFFRVPGWTSAINTLRLRGSWGQAGQQPDAFAALRLYSPTTGPGSNPAITPLSIGNPKLRPERGSELDFGFDLTSKNDVVSLEYTHYSRKTTDAIVNVPVQPSTGFPGNQIMNIGRTSNWGDEISSTIKVLDGSTVGWDMNVAYSTMHNMVDDLGGVELANYRVGYPVTSIFLERVVHAEFDGSNKLVNVLCDGGPGQAPTTCDVAPTVFWGVGQPTSSGSLSNTVTLWHRLRLLATVDGQFGSHSVDGDIRDANTNFQNSAKIWTSPPDPYFAAYQTVAPKPPLGFYDAGFVKLRELSATYTGSTKLASRVGAQSLSLTGAWRNVAILWQQQKYANTVRIPDPEVRSPGLGNSYTYQTTIPPTSMFVFTMRLSY